MNRSVVIIPAYNPGLQLLQIVRALEKTFSRIVVVDDGSTEDNGIFARLAEETNAAILRHPENRGKGAALKTAFAEVLSRYPDAPGVVTVDADGQHLPSDVVRVAETGEDDRTRMVIGVRVFSGKVPFRSLWGNLWTRGEFFLLTGMPVSDTQTGLRWLPRALLPQALKTPGERYEYEIRLLVRAARSDRRPLQVPITTVYEDGNASSHFRPFADTLRTQAALFTAGRFTCS